MHDLDLVKLEMDEDYDDDEFGNDYDDDEFDYDDESPFDPDEEMELATELMSISDDDELEYFLGKVFKKAWRGVKKVARSPLVRKLARAAKPLVKKALPWVGRAAGTWIGGPAGAALGGKLASLAASRLEIDITGLTEDEVQFEVARKVVRLLGSAAQKAASAPAGAHPATVARKAVASAARSVAPGLIGAAGALSGKRSGRWVRRGRRIILHGV